MAYNDKLMSAKEDTLNKADQQIEKNSNDADAGLQKSGHEVAKTGGEIQNKDQKFRLKIKDMSQEQKREYERERYRARKILKKENNNNNANDVFSSIGNKIRAFFEGGWTRNEYIGFWTVFGILVTGGLICGFAATCPHDLSTNIQESVMEVFDKAYIDFKKFGEDMEKSVDNVNINLEKFGSVMQKSPDHLEGISFDKAGRELEMFGKYMEEEIDNTNVEMKKFNHDMQGSFDRTTSYALKAFNNATQGFEKVAN